METGPLKAKIGESDIQGKFSVDDFRKPVVMVHFSADRLHAQDLGWTSPKDDASFSVVSAEAVWKSGDLQVSRLSFGLGKTFSTRRGASGILLRRKLRRR